MNTFKIIPYIGMGPLKLGSEKHDIIHILGDPDSYTDTSNVTQLYYPGFCIHLNRNGKVEFISASIDKGYSVTFLGLDLLRVEASKIIERISTKHEYDEKDFELGYSYIYPDIQMSFYRNIIPENKDDKNGKFFQTVGIAEPKYWS